jgi:hypothetical protein
VWNQAWTCRNVGCRRNSRYSNIYIVLMVLANSTFTFFSTISLLFLCCHSRRSNREQHSSIRWQDRWSCHLPVPRGWSADWFWFCFLHNRFDFCHWKLGNWEDLEKR